MKTEHEGKSATEHAIEERGEIDIIGPQLLHRPRGDKLLGNTESSEEGRRPVGLSLG